MGESLRSFEELKCWQACRELRNFVYKLVKKLPPEEKFGLSDDMRRAARSTTHNTAEGFGRFHFQENIQFCRISRGSIFELLDQVITCKDEEFISEIDYEQGARLIFRALPLVNGYIRYLKKGKYRSAGITSDPETAEPE